MKKHTKSSKQRRAQSVRSKIRGDSDRPRLSISRSNQRIYAQIIDDSKGVTLVSAIDLETEDKDTKSSRAKRTGKQIAEKALMSKITQVKFDRGPFAYHGRVKALAEAAREAGLQF